MNITEKLFENRDPGYRDFQCRLMPTVDPEAVLGVRTPVLRGLAKTIDDKTAAAFIKELPHRYYEENNLHAFLVERERDIDKCYDLVNEFLPYIDNWATCDSFSPKVLKKDKKRLLESIDKWMSSYEIYTVRFGIGMLMRYFLDGDFCVGYHQKVASVESEEYYVRMMCAWYFATALAKQYDEVLPYIEENRLDVWTHNKTIQKAVESYRITPQQKAYLKTLKRKDI